jgi:REP element-mobilizing transposase RayT
MDEGLPVQVFDPTAEVTVVDRRLPHWSQPGAIAFITWRTADSLPAEILDRWFENRKQWLACHGIDVNRPDWKESLAKLDNILAATFRALFWNRWHDALDKCRGTCILRESNIAQIVVRSLHYFDLKRYSLLDFVVMPNHVHLLASFPTEEGMLIQCESWKHYTATEINRALGRKGLFWQQDAYDHLVRSEDQFEYLRRYIAANPSRARLRTGEFAVYSKQ